MSYQDPPRIMTGTIPRPSVPSDHYKHDPSDILETFMGIVENKVWNSSEMEVVVRVFLVVIDAVKDLPVIVRLQPSQDYHTTFTDILFLLSDSGKEVCLIEVKRSVEFTTFAILLILWLKLFVRHTSY